jgi:hypothetical protein
MSRISKYDPIVDAVREIQPGETTRHFIPKRITDENARRLEASRIGKHLYARGVKCSLRRFEHIVLITRMFE